MYIVEKSQGNYYKEPAAIRMKRINRIGLLPGFDEVMLDYAEGT